MFKITGFFKTVCLLVPMLLLGQNQESNQDIYVLFDDVVGHENTGLYNGIEYRETYRTLNNNHPYFESPDFVMSSIAYDGQLYFNIHLKYNLYDQEVIAKLKSQNQSETVIHKSFKNNGVYGFYEEAYKDGDFSLLIKYQKFKKDLYQNEQMYVDFVSSKKEYYIVSNGNYKDISSKKDISKLFPDFKAQINQFYRDHRSLSKTDYDQFLVQLLQELKLAKLK